MALLYRAHADDIVSHVGLAWSDDGYRFEREPEPVLSPSEDYDGFGCEDARVTAIDGTYYLTYSGWDRPAALLCLATSTDLRTWTKHGPLFPDFDTFQPQGRGETGPWSKAGGIVPVKVNGRWLMYFGEGSIWTATSDDLLHWTPTVPDTEPPVMAPRPGTFSDFLVEVGPQPLITDDGLILLLHNAAVKNPDGSVRYTAGQLLIHPDRPDEILAELTRPWLEPVTLRGTPRPRVERDVRRGPGVVQGPLAGLLRPVRLDPRGGDVRARGAALRSVGAVMITREKEQS